MNTTLRRVLIPAIVLLAAVSASADQPGTLHQAARAGDSVGVAALLAGGADVNAVDADGMTALHLAAQRGDAALVALLLSAGAEANAQDKRGRTPLHYAAASNQTDVLDALLGGGAKVGLADRYGDTPLHHAARFARPAAIGRLLAAGAVVNARNAFGQSPLHVLGLSVRESDDREVESLLAVLARVLIEAGADAAAQDNDGLPAWPHPEAPRADRTPPGYPTYDQIVTTLQSRAAQYPSLCKAYDLGPTSTNKNIWALRISDNVALEEDEPEFKWISTMHGDEVTGVVLCLNMIDYLLTNYGSDPRVINIVNSIDIWFVPCMNPWGYINNSRYNANGVDLNRNFPEGSQGEANTIEGRAKETQTIMLWSFANSFTLAANYHGGTLVVNYPYDNDGQGSVYSPTPDDDLFIYISEEYSKHNPPMWNSSEFYHGITNGAAWYAISGGMQDWDYRYMGGNEVTIEVSQTKSPPYSQMPQFWNDNRESMLSYMETCLMGVRGLVTDLYTGDPVAATVTIVGRDHKVYTDPDVGDYHRMLKPGSYQIKFEAPGYDAVTFPVTVNSGPATVLNVQLGPSARVTYPNGGEQLSVNVPVTVTWVGNPTAQFHVQYTGNYGQTQTITDDFERTTLGSDYTTGGNANWAISTTSYHSPTRSARAGAIGNNQSTWLKRTVSGTQVNFWYRVSSEQDYDFFNFYIDGQQKLHKSGNVAWTLFSATMPAGSHELKWEYVKDYYATGGSDTAWIDDLTVDVDLTNWVNIVDLTPPGASSTPWTPTQIGDDYKIRVRACYGGGNYGAWDESDNTFTVQQPQWPLGDLNCDGVVTFADINPFVLALTDPGAYAAQYPGCNIMNGDCNQDGKLDFGDINPFVDILAS